MKLDDLIYPKMLRLATCLCCELEDSGLPKPCTCSVMPGQQVAIDYADCGNDTNGVAWVRLAQASAYTTQGAPMLSPVNCDTPLQATLEVGIMRMIHLSDDGEPPSSVEMMASTELQLADMAAMRRAITCCYGTSVLGTYTPSGPAGGIVGGAWAVGITSLDDIDD